MQITRMMAVPSDLPAFLGPLLILGCSSIEARLLMDKSFFPAVQSHGPSGTGEVPGSGIDCNSWRLNSRGVRCPRLECGRISLN